MSGASYFDKERNGNNNSLYAEMKLVSLIIIGFSRGSPVFAYILARLTSAEIILKGT